MMSRELDEAIAHAIGLEKRAGFPTGACWYYGDKFAYRVSEFKPSPDWEHLDPLIDLLEMEIEYNNGIPIVKLPTDIEWHAGADESGPNLMMAVVQAILLSATLSNRINPLHIQADECQIH